MYPYAPVTSGVFTIVELLIVIVVIAILAAISIVAYTGIQNRAAISVLQSDLRNAAAQLGTKQVEDGSYPNPSLPSDVSGSSGTTFYYTSDGTSYCLTAVSSRSAVSAYHVSSASPVSEGSCSGHPSGGGGGVTLNCPTGFISVPGSSHYGTGDFCVMQYEAKNVGGIATSQANGTPWVSISQTNAIAQSANACDGCALITEAQWMTIATNVLSVDSNWSGGSVGSGTFPRGNSNSSAALDGSGDLSGVNKRTLTLTNGEIIWDFAGNVWEWTQGTIMGGQPGLSGESNFTWKDYNNGSLQWNSLPSSSRPTGTLYPRSAGVGGLSSNTGDSSARAFHRGGSWSNSSDAGVLSVILSAAPPDAYTSIGFRVAR